MFEIDSDMTIYITRGDVAFFSVTAEDNGERYKFQPGDVVRIKVTQKKNCENVAFQKDFPVLEETETVEILLTEEETKIGDVISKPVDYWYEVELNPYTNPQTIIGYDDDGPKIFKLFPEGRDLNTTIEKEELPVVDSELSLTSDRPVENQAIARAITDLSGVVKKVSEDGSIAVAAMTKKVDDAVNKASKDTERLDTEIAVERARLNNLVANTGEQTEGNAELIDIRTGEDGTVYETAGDAVRGQVGDLKSDLSKLEVESSERYDVLQSANLYDATQNTDGYYIPYNTTTGDLVTLSDYSVSDFIPVVGGTSVAIGRTVDYTSIGSIHTVFYDEAKNILSGQGVLADDSNNPVTVPNDAAFMRFSMGANAKSSYCIVEGDTAEYGIYYRTIVPKTQKYVDVTMPTSTDCLRYWLNCVGSLASEEHIVRLHIPTGIYHTYAYYTDAERAETSFKGMFLPNYVILVGHDKEDTILSCVLDTASSEISTLNLMGTGGLKNLTIKGTNTRYAIHDDFATSAYTDYTDYYYRWVEDCIIEATNPTMGQAYGSGSRSGAIWKFKNVIFKGGFSWHSNVNFKIPSDITLENCINETNGFIGMPLKSLASGVINKVHLIGCSIPMITCSEETSGIGIDFTIDGYGNGHIPIDYKTTAEDFPVPFITDSITEIKAGNEIAKGGLVFKSAIYGYVFGTRDARRLYGIAIEKIESGAYGKVLTQGYYLASELGLSDFDDGTMLTTKNGSLAVASANDYVVGCIETMWETKFLHLFN